MRCPGSDFISSSESERYSARVLSRPGRLGGRKVSRRQSTMGSMRGGRGSKKTRGRELMQRTDRRRAGHFRTRMRPFPDAEQPTHGSQFFQTPEHLCEKEMLPNAPQHTEAERSANLSQLPATTRWYRLHGRPSRQDKAAKQQYLSPREETALAEYAPRMAHAENPLPVKSLRVLAQTIRKSSMILRSVLRMCTTWTRQAYS